MQTYVGNGHYCWANSTAMLLESAEASIEPRLIEVLSGVGLGAFWLDGPSLLFLSGRASPPDIGVSRALELLGFGVQEAAEADGAALSIDALAGLLETGLAQGPVMLGPLDMGELTYRPNAHAAIGVDHYVLALSIEGAKVLVHDPAGYPCVPIALNALERAWRADRISYRRGSYRRWQAPVRVASPSPAQILETAILSFIDAYKAARVGTSPGVTMGPEAIEKVASTIRQRELPETSLRHLERFVLALGVRRALDYDWYLRRSHPDLARVKHQQALSLGRAHAASVSRDWDRLADALGRVAEFEHQFEVSLAGSGTMYRAPGS